MIFGRRADGTGARPRREGGGERLDVAYPAAELGRRGEDIAAAFVCRKGWRILERNWRYGHVELDLVALDGRELVFVEVKTRTAGGVGSPADGLTPAKRAHVCKAAQAWLSAHDAWDRPCRFDVLCLVHDGTTFNVEHMPDAFRFSDGRRVVDCRNAAWQPW